MRTSAQSSHSPYVSKVTVLNNVTSMDPQLIQCIYITNFGLCSGVYYYVNQCIILVSIFIVFAECN